MKKPGKPSRRVMVVGGAMTKPGRDPVDYRQYAARPFFEALDGLGLKPDDLEVIAVAYNERSVPDAAIAPMMSDALTGLRVPVVPVSAACTGGGVAAFNMYHYIASGRYDLGAVVSFSRSEVFFPMDTASAMGNHSDVDFALGLTHIQYSSLKESLYMQKHHPGDYAPEARWAMQDHWYAKRNPYATLHKGDMPSEADLLDPGITGYRARSAAGREQACCLIMMSEDAARRFPDAVRFDMALSFRSPYLGAHFNYPLPEHREADITRQPGVALAAREALEMADLGIRDVNLFQVHDLTPADGFMQLESLGLARPGEMCRLVMDGVTAPTGPFPTNTDGGAIAFGHSSVGGDFPSKVIENLLQLRGQAGERQVAGARVALAHAYGTHQSVDSVAIMQGGPR